MAIQWKQGARKQNAKQTCFARSLRKNQTDAEKKLWYFLRGLKSSNHFKFRRQVPFGRYYLDFYCAGEKLVVELDGGQHYTLEGKLKDQRRDDYLRSNGLKVLRFSDSDALLHTDIVMESILKVLQKDQSSPYPLLFKERVQ
jgi:very-short-patch-repair endonuclease